MWTQEEARYGQPLKLLNGNAVAALASIDGFFCNCAFRITEIARTEEAFFDAILFTFGVHRDPAKDFNDAVIDARAAIASIPKKRRAFLRLEAEKRIRNRTPPSSETLV